MSAPLIKLKITPTSSTSSTTSTQKHENDQNNIKPKITTLKVVPKENTKEPEKSEKQTKQSPPKEEHRVGAENYSRYKDARDHIYNISDTYVGNDEKMPRDERVYDLETSLFKEVNITLPQAVERVFVETTSNAGDNVARSLRKDVDPGEVTITMDKKIIKVRNGGIPIPVEIHPTEKIWVPEMIFGILMSSSNYDKEKVRTECGKNGYGIKACLHFNTLVPTFTGKLKRAFDLTVEDKLIGDDGAIRRITSIANGRGKMYEVTQMQKGEPYIVNDKHILTLHMPDHKVIFWNKTKNGWGVLWWDHASRSIKSKIEHIGKAEGIVCQECGLGLSGNLARHYSRKHEGIEVPKNKRKSPTDPPDTVESKAARSRLEDFCKNIPDDNTLDIAIQDYMELNKTTQSRLAGLRGKCVQWPRREVDLDPYLLGLWLGDGFQRGDGISSDESIDPETIEYLQEWCKQNNACVKKSGSCSHYIRSLDNITNGTKLPNPFKSKLDRYNLLNVKHIPDEYMVNDRDTRLKVLAGLIDSDGHVDKEREGTRATICQGLMHKELAEDIVFLARSLGFYCSFGIYDRSWTYKGEKRFGECYEMRITGDLEDIPTRLPRKKCANGKVHSALTTGQIKIREVEDADYVAIEVDKNHRFLINDFTVTHNCNIFSKRFSILVADPYNEKIYSQTWTDNMKAKNEPIISSYSRDEKGFVEVEYELDFKRFGYEEYPDEAFELFSRHAADMAFTLKNPVSFNGRKFNITSAKEYAKLYFGKEAVKSSILYMSWPEGTETVTKKNVEYAKNKSVLPTMEICAIDTPDNAIKVSFANGMWTRNGGVHYEAAFKAIATSLLDTINGDDRKKKKKEKNDKIPKLKLIDVKKHVSLIVSCWVGDPKFDSQSKSELKSPSVKVTIDEKILRPIMKWELIARLYAELEAKQYKITSKSDGRKKRFLTGMDKLHDANKAASSESSNCILYITEGDSALTFAIKLCSFIPDGKGRDYVGMYPLKGKPLNVMNANQLQIAENKEINDLKQVLGLREGVNYLNEDEYQTLRYGHLMILADADNDGKHILGLIINLFHCKYPTLLARGYVKYLRTKILEAKKGSNKVKFYTQHEFEEWKKVTPDHESWKLFYYKGLGTSEDHDIKEESKDPKIVMTVYDQFAPRSLQLAFDQSLSDLRKEWIGNWIPDYTVETMKVQPISSFINHEFIQFSIADLGRSIPRFTDGLKISQRKIVYAALKKWGSKAGDKAERMKVAQFAPYVSEKMQYHYGEKSLEGAIVGMAQNFVGSNNLPYLERNGNFGSRSMLGKDQSAGRYIYTKPEFFIPYVFKKEDGPILNIIKDEGQEIEPVTLLPIIPMHLINGVLGIGSGFSTYIPAHNPLDIVYWLQCKIQGMVTPDLIPWYKGFNGEIKLKKKKKDDSMSETDDENDEDPDEVLIDKNTKVSMVTYGDFKEEGNARKKITITELPVGRSIHSYELYLKKLREEKKITRYDDYSTVDIPKFEVYGFKDTSKLKKVTLKKLKLIKSYGMSNMVLLDDNNRPVKYDDANAIMETFYTIRLAYYEKRKNYIINDISDHIGKLNAKIKFILAVIKGYELIKGNSKITDEEANTQEGILVVGRNKKDIYVQMNRCGFNEDFLKKITLYNCTYEEVQIARDEISKLEEELKIKQETKPENMWLEDLDEFVKVYCKNYNIKYEPPKKITLKLLEVNE